MNAIATRVLAGDVRAVARACRIVDDRVAGYRTLLRDLFPHSGRAWVIGITGPPGAGKSTLADCLISELRAEKQRVGVIAVDPSSPFTGGAVLGDRIRMQQHFEDAGVFIRSLATRGALGGLSRSAADVLCVLDAWGADVVLVETVGVGQDELEVTRAAHSTLVVMAPGLGDDVQAAKAGLMECADVFALNKADRDGADSAALDILQGIAIGRAPPVVGSGHAVHGRALPAGSLALTDAAQEWTPPVVKCVASRKQGVPELVNALRAHRAWLEGTPEGATRKRARAQAHLLQNLRDALSEAIVLRLGPEIDDAIRRVHAREQDPYTACDELVARFAAADD